MTELIPSDVVYRSDSNNPITDSLKVAEVFGKNHRDVLRAIRNLTAQNCAAEKLFFETTYLNEQKHEMPMFVMNKDGFSLLVMGFTGDKALEFKLAYIEQFNKMEAYIKQQQAAIPTNPMEMYLQQTKALAAALEANLKNETDIADLRKDFNSYKAEQKQKEADALAELREVELSKEEAAPLTPRAATNLLVRNYAEANNVDFRKCWHQLYAEFIPRYHVNLKMRAANCNMKPLDYAEKFGFMKSLYAVASRLFGKKNK